MKHLLILATLVTGATACHHDKQAATQPTDQTAMPTQDASDPDLATETVSGIDIEPKLAELCSIPSNRVFFKFDSATVRPDAKEVLDLLATCMVSGPGKGQNLRVVGRTDPRGTETYNQQLGQNRASAVSAYLQTAGVGADQVDAVSEGESQAGENPMNWPFDRRVTIRLRG